MGEGEPWLLLAMFGHTYYPLLIVNSLIYSIQMICTKRYYYELIKLWQVPPLQPSLAAPDSSPFVASAAAASPPPPPHHPLPSLVPYPHPQLLPVASYITCCLPWLTDATPESHPRPNPTHTSPTLPKLHRSLHPSSSCKKPDQPPACTPIQSPSSAPPAAYMYQLPLTLSSSLLHCLTASARILNTLPLLALPFDTTQIA